MPSFTITATDNGGDLQFSGAQGGATFNNDTITFPPGAMTVTIVQGTSVTLASSLALPTVFSNGLVSVSPASATLNSNGQYVFTCSNGLTAGLSTVTNSCTVSATIAGVGQSAFPALATATGFTVIGKDPTMIFNPPQ